MLVTWADAWRDPGISDGFWAKKLLLVRWNKTRTRAGKWLVGSDRGRPRQLAGEAAGAMLRCECPEEELAAVHKVAEGRSE